MKKKVIEKLKMIKVKKSYWLLRSFYKRNTDSVIIATAFFVLATAVNLTVDIFFSSKVSNSTLIIILGFLVISFILFLFYQLKKVFDQRFDKEKNILIDYFGWAAQINDYYRRKQHFVEEKQLLARTITNECLPRLIDNELNENKEIKTINVFLDAGTTIAEIFPLIASNGIENVQNDLSINLITNNLAGIIDLHKRGEPKSFKIKEECIHLLGGEPLYDYQAVTGHATEEAIENFCNNFNLGDPTVRGKALNIGIITANWVMAGLDLKEITLCARGKGHLSIKKAILDKTDYVFVVVPLAKIIRIEKLEYLNEISPYKDPYEGHKPNKEKQKKLILVTTKRNILPLNLTSEHLMEVRNDKKSVNYTLSEFFPEYTIEGDKEEVERKEFPQDYVRKHKHKLYSINP